MSVWNSLLSWGLRAAKSEAQTIGLKALQDSSAQLTQVINEHAPDLAPSLQPLMSQLINGAVAGIMTKVH